MKPKNVAFQTVEVTRMNWYAQNNVPARLIIEVGTPCTVFVGSDSYGGKVVEISESKKTVWIDYGAGHERKACRSFDQDGQTRWRLTGKLGTRPNWRVAFGAAVEYRDRSF